MMGVLATVWGAGAVWFLLIGLVVIYKDVSQPVDLELPHVLVLAVLWPLAALVSLHGAYWDFLEDDWDD